jgi:hypothetical protein
MPVDDVAEEEVIALNNGDLTQLSDYSDEDDIDDDAYSLSADIPRHHPEVRINMQYRGDLMPQQQLSLVIDKVVTNSAVFSADIDEPIKHLRPLRPKTPEEDEDSYYYERPVRNADSAPPTLTTVL